jgi:ABC-2 type transport system ATP-binding protein
MTNAISARGLSKHFGNVYAVKEMDLEIEPGEIYGFLGRNGAGKTTTIRMLLGLIRSDGGTIRLFGKSVTGERNEALAQAGCLVESATAYPNLTVRENLELQCLLTGVPKAKAGDALERLRLEKYADRKSNHLSLGNKQRLSLARALVASPRLLVLDEPANGLDPAGIVEIRELLREIAREGTTVFMSSHILEEVDRLADRIGIVHDGSLVEEIDFHGSDRRKRLRIEVTVTETTEAVKAGGSCAVEKAENVLREKLALKDITRRGNTELLIADPDANGAAVARELVGAGIGVERLLPVEENLEEHFMRITGGQS